MIFEIRIRISASFPVFLEEILLDKKFSQVINKLK